MAAPALCGVILGKRVGSTAPTRNAVRFISLESTRSDLCPLATRR